VKAEANIIRQDALGVINTSADSAFEHLLKLVELPELRKVSKALYVVGIVGKDLVEGGVAVLEAACMNRNNEYSRLKQPLVLNE